MKVKSQDIINYGKMETYLDKQENYLKEQANQNILQFQKLLLYLQQMPIIKNNDEIIQEVEQYLKELEQGLNDKDNPLTNNASLIWKVYSFINGVNQGQNALKINERLQKIFIPMKINEGQQNILLPQMKQFLVDNNIKQLRIEPLISDEQIDKLKRITQLFQQYHNRKYKNKKIQEVQHLKLNLKLWCSYQNENMENKKLENAIYELKYITKRIQKGPQQDIENGIYIIGVTKVGKSTIINSLLYPDKIVQTDFLRQKCYGIELDTKFQIGNSKISETQKINGVYIGIKEELNQIFEQDQSVFSFEEIQAQNQINQCKIPQKWLIFDCPGFDDNSNELMRIAHRISLYNYFSKTKKLIVFFVIDITSKTIEDIKKTFDPITSLLENKDDLVSNFEKWTNLILTKGKEGTRQQYLEKDNWEKAYQGYLDQDQNYSFYKKLFEHYGRCIEFPKPSKNINEIIQHLTNSIIQMSQNQINQDKIFNPKFQPAFDQQVKTLYEHSIKKVKLKLEYIIQFLLQYLDEYILESDDVIEEKKVQVEKIKRSLLNQSTKQMYNVITLENYKEILQALSDWVRDNKYIKNNDLFLQSYIEDIQSILQISQYCKNDNNIATFEIKIDNLLNKIVQNLKKIEVILKNQEGEDPNIQTDSFQEMLDKIEQDIVNDSFKNEEKINQQDNTKEAAELNITNDEKGQNNQFQQEQTQQSQGGNDYLERIFEHSLESHDTF